METLIKKMLEIWVERDNNCYINSYNFIKNNGGYYTISVMEKDKEDNIFLSIYEMEINNSSCRIIEIE
jgi:hypothetical protein